VDKFLVGHAAPGRTSRGAAAERLSGERTRHGDSDEDSGIYLSMMLDASESTSTGMRITTMNCRSMPGRLPSIFELMSALGTDVLLLQETRLGKESEPTVREAARARGMRAFFETATADASGAYHNGVCIFTAWPAEQIALPPRPQYLGRVLAIQVARVDARPLTLACVYGHAAQAGEAITLQTRLFEDLHVQGDDFFAAGDWNRTVQQRPMGQLIAAGLVAWADEQWQYELRDTFHGKQKRRRQREPRVIDFEVHHRHVTVHARRQGTGVADHDYVSYDIDATRPAPACKRPPRTPIDLCQDETIIADNWAAEWALHGTAFWQQLQDGRAEAAWMTLSRVAEAALTSGEAPARGRGQLLTATPSPA
jgi:endonuclease/exonuclease/phosphatase family metal-dependent hydrolase